MAESGDETVVLLNRWYDGEKDALSALLNRNLDWMRLHVRNQLSGPMRQKFDSMDVVQDGVIRLLKWMS